MTMLLRLVKLLVAGVGPLLMPCGCGRGRDLGKDFTINGTADLRVEVDDGRVTLTGTEPNGLNAGDRRRLADRSRRRASAGPAGRRPRGNRRARSALDGPFYMGNRSIRVEIRCQMVHWRNVHTHDGSITVEGLRGTLKLKTGDGRIEATRVDGTLDASTGDGSIRIRGRLDGLALHTADGSIEARVERRVEDGSPPGTSTPRRPCDAAPAKDSRSDLDAHTGDGGSRSISPSRPRGRPAATTCAQNRRRRTTLKSARRPARSES